MQKQYPSSYPKKKKSEPLRPHGTQHRAQKKMDRNAPRNTPRSTTNKPTPDAYIGAGCEESDACSELGSVAEEEEVE